MEMKNLFVKLMATLWENTYRIVINDQNDQYVATGRVIVAPMNCRPMHRK